VGGFTLKKEGKSAEFRELLGLEKFCSVLGAWNKEKIKGQPAKTDLLDKWLCNLCLFLKHTTGCASQHTWCLS